MQAPIVHVKNNHHFTSSSLAQWLFLVSIARQRPQR